MNVGRPAKLWETIGNVGVDPDDPPRLAQQIQISNHIGVFFALIAIPCFLVLAWAAPTMTPWLALIMMALASSLVLNRFRWHHYGRLAPVLVGNATILVVAQSLGPESNAHLALFPMTILPFFLFSTHEWIFIAILEITSFGNFLLFLMPSVRLLPPVRLAPDAWTVFPLMAAITAFLPFPILFRFLYAADRRREQTLRRTVADLEIEMQQRRQTEIELRLAKELADAGARAKSEFAAVMSHEIRTPMNAIVGMATLLLEASPTQGQREMLRVIEAAGQTLITLVNDVLDLSKIDAGRLTLERNQFSPSDVAEDALVALAPLAEQKGIDAIFETRGTVPATIWGDASRIRQVITNLLGNAFKFTHEGWVRLELAFMGEDDQRPTMQVKVSDTGIGIPAEARSRIFEAFTQADSTMTRRYGGSGLGLSISERLVKQMGGQIGFESEEGRGSTFWFRWNTECGVPGKCYPTDVLHGRKIAVVGQDSPFLTAWKDFFSSLDATLLEKVEPNCDAMVVIPRGLETAELSRIYRDATATGCRVVVFGATASPPPCGATVLPRIVKRQRVLDALSPSHPSSATIGTVPNTRTETSSKVDHTIAVLVAEDNVVNRMIACAALEKLGARCTIAENGEDALKRFEEDSFDLVLMDVQMPILDGYAATRAIRNLERSRNGSHVPVVALTANASEEDRRAALDAGMNGFLAKPIRIPDLRTAVLQFARGSR